MDQLLPSSLRGKLLFVVTWILPSWRGEIRSGKLRMCPQPGVTSFKYFHPYAQNRGALFHAVLATLAVVCRSALRQLLLWCGL